MFMVALSNHSVWKLIAHMFCVK